MKWRNTGTFGEDPVKRDHHEENKFNRLFCNKSKWEERKKLINNSKALCINSKIASATAKVIESTSRKRSLNINNQEEDDKRQKKAAAKVSLIKKIILRTPNNSNSSATSNLSLDQGDDESTA